VALLNRYAERAALGRLLDAARAGQSGVLVMRGVPGIGKTALLEDAIESATGFRVARVVGVESEMELAFAALQQLCGPMLDRADRLPVPQRDALGVAFGLRAGDVPDRFLVGLAALSLLSEAAVERPLLCVIDDAHWLDRVSAQVLGFVARRLLAEPVALVVATREPGEGFSGLPELLVEGLRTGDARELLSSVAWGQLDERVQDRILAETGGNPLALLELPQALTVAELAGGFGVLDSRGLPGRIEESFRRRLEVLPADSRQLLLVAAADPVGEPALMWRAAWRLGIGAQAAAAAEAAEAAGLVMIGERVTFRHPLVRSAVYRAASPPERRAAHQALAEATDHGVDPDRRAWHSAQATLEPDERVAAELERQAGSAQARGGLAAAAAFFERSAELTLQPGRRAERTLAAAQAKHLAGAFDAALRLVAAAEAGPLDDFQRARLSLLRGQIAFASSRGSDAPPLLLTAARQLEPLDVRLARETYLEALSAAVFAGRLALGGGVREVAEAARAAPPSPPRVRPPDLLLDGLAALITQGFAAAAPLLKRAVAIFRSADVSTEEELRWLGLGCSAAGLVWDYESWDVLSARLVKVAREAGALTALRMAYSTRALVHLCAGDFTDAASLVAEAESVTAAMGSGIAVLHAAVALAALRGREAEAAVLIELATKDVHRRGSGQGLSLIHWAIAVLCNSLGRYEQALAAAQQASEDSQAQLISNWAIAELIEAATRTGMSERTAGALDRLSEMARASGTDWALGIEARSRALITDGENAEVFYGEAIDRLGRAGLGMELARAQLLYGEWLRRRRRRHDARDPLRSAYETFDSIGAEAFAARARTELRATGGQARERTVDARDALTPQEALIARLAGRGASNPEIAAQLFISRATVAYHLRKVFVKLGVTSRDQLAQVLPARPDRTVPAATQRLAPRAPRSRVARQAIQLAIH
jgi:DNA-binding CsgD family transcriptional regulator/tetratricopeptide (TPR) repeat protein